MSAHAPIPASAPLAKGMAKSALAWTRMGDESVFAAAPSDLRWVEASRPGLRLAAVTQDRAAGRFLGLIGFDPLATTGLHQHLDVAFSYFLDGGLFDYQGAAVAGDMGVNLRGATHDAVAYAKTLAASRLEGPVLYEGPGAGGPALHAGATVAPIVNEDPEVLPDLNIPVDRLPWTATSLPRISRRMIFDYLPVDRDSRCVQLQFLPGGETPPLQTSAPLHLFVIGGALDVERTRIGAGSFGIVEPGSTVRLRSAFGALLIAWADGPSRWVDSDGPDLFGFPNRRALLS